MSIYEAFLPTPVYWWTFAEHRAEIARLGVSAEEYLVHMGAYLDGYALSRLAEHLGIE